MHGSLFLRFQPLLPGLVILASHTIHRVVKFFSNVTMT